MRMSTGHFSRQTLVTLLAAVFFMATAVGCGRSGPSCIRVQGHVTYRGKPLGTGSICFTPVGQAPGKPAARPASGELQPDGSYAMQTFGNNDGALPGEYSVSIVAWDYSRPASNRGPDGRPLPAGVSGKPASLIPERYSVPEMSGLTATVSPDASEPLELNFDLRD
jgi:hypothetical protein